MKKSQETDYSTGWRHFDVTPPKPNQDTQLGHLIYSISGNNFGDQIIHYRRFEFTHEENIGGKMWKMYSYVTYHTETNQEGSWVPHEFIKKTAKQMSQKRKSA